MNITESKPRRQPIILFGAPERPTEPQENTDINQERQEYQQNMVTPDLQRILKKEPEYTLTRI